jgi:hypothetical protein
MCCLFAVDDSFAESSRKLEQTCGQRVSQTAIERAVQQVGSAALGQQDQQLDDFLRHRKPAEAEVHPQRLYVAADGTKPKPVVSTGKASDLTGPSGILHVLIIRGRLDGICGWRRADVACSKLKR